MGAKEVAAGAEWLDENFPGWEREIDLGRLNLSSCRECVCGQSLRKFVSGRARDGFDIALLAATGHTYPDKTGISWATLHGFFVHGDRDDWTDIETLWRGLIKKRFGTGHLSDA